MKGNGNVQQASLAPTSSHPTSVIANRVGFTLVELLVVITIIGILAGLATKGISAALRAAASGKMSIEVSNLATAAEAYKQKYGDYPPDFSDAPAVARHYRKIFPKILSSELSVLASAMTRYVPTGDLPQGIDEAEALVFCLGGYSSDPQRPFTGTGGPLQLIAGAPAGSTSIDNYQYNTDRNPGQFEFDVGRLTLFPDTLPVRSYDDSYDSALISSTDVVPVWDPALGNNNPPTSYSGLSDPFPVYRPKDREMPYVYFNAKSYGFTATIGTATAYYFNSYRPRDPNLTAATLDYFGVARPYKSAQVNTAAMTGAKPTTLAAGDAARFYENKDSFQIICAGYDGHFGGVFGLLPVGSSASAAVNFIGTTGDAFRADVVVTQANTTWPIAGSTSNLGQDTNGGQFKYEDPTVPAAVLALGGNAQHDNLTNFTNGSELGDGT